MTTLPILNVNAEITAPAEHTQLCFQICDFPQNHGVTASKVYALLQKQRFNASQAKKGVCTANLLNCYHLTFIFSSKIAIFQLTVAV
ncbi:hypothetical protein [Cronobacter malonaticus]|uniref:hypothetical protein n=1 Tax=Cronobacter malonaticus TaxID=413503 RepID=UPI0024C42922|nr:hypothetical protein [Cronobacter malonaticus]MDI7689813.1 hypothetical protein [Cronobacter malonaticus]MDK1300123.1 hypothetical protein [Cronobacter malonaticus]